MKKRIVFSCIAVLLVLTLLAGCAAKNDRATGDRIGGCSASSERSDQAREPSKCSRAQQHS